jgi:aspartyl-tRNA(Asn)/glutamyl-tRNA(Gln) amidotransferase subunit A
MTPLRTLADDLGAGRTTSRNLAEEALARIDDAGGEGARVMLKVDEDAVRASAEESDRARASGIVASPIAGIPVSLKDLFDVAGEVTTAGSVVLRNAAPAEADAAVVARLRRAGAVIIGRTNMTEFAYSGLGLNPHYGTPKNPWDRNTGRIAGGSSAGAAVSVTDGMAAAALGTDTGGSVRIPAALCGLAGFKPTQRRVPLDGVYPLLKSLDSVGPLAPTVACCAIMDAVLADQPPIVPEPRAIQDLRFAVPQRLVLEALDDYVAANFAQALTRLSAAGAGIVEIPFAELLEIPELNKGGAIYVEAYAVHRKLLEHSRDMYDPRVASRIMRVAGVAAADYIDVIAARAGLIARANTVTETFDGVLMPTTATVAPQIAVLEADDKLYNQTNLLMLRNTFCANFLDRPALTIPMHRPAEAPPAGLMVMGETDGDAGLIAAGLAIESVLRD